MFLTLKKGYRFDVPLTRKLMNAHGFSVRTYADDPAKINVFLMPKYYHLYKDDAEIMFALEAAVTDEQTGTTTVTKIIKAIHGKTRK